MSASEYRIRVCKPGPNAWLWCNHVGHGKPTYYILLRLLMMIHVRLYNRSSMRWAVSGTCLPITPEVSIPAKATLVFLWVCTVRMAMRGAAHSAVSLRSRSHLSVTAEDCCYSVLSHRTEGQPSTPTAHPQPATSACTKINNLALGAAAPTAQPAVLR